MKRSIFALLVLPIISFDVSADFNAGLDATAITVQHIMADPPLPASENEKGKHSIKAKPGYIFGETEANYSYGEGATSAQTGKVKGPTAAAVHSYSINNKWGIYSWVVGSSLKGDFETRQNNESNPSIFAKNVEAKVLNLSFGASYQVFDKAKKGYGLSLFSGPYLPMYWYKQHYLNQSTGFEADLEANETFVGVLFGAQWDFDLGENWGFQPFVIFGDTFGSNDFLNPFGDSGECRDYKIKNITSGNIASAQLSESDCKNKREFVYDTQLGGLGLNLTYKPWNISTNLFTPFINQLIFKLFYEDEKPKLFYLSFTWHGNL